jgi:polyisoprenoid-binding protein YceI
MAAAAAILLVACAKEGNEAPAPVDSNAAEAALAPEETPAVEAAASAFDASAAPSGVYKSDPGHTYTAFTYNHMGYSNPIVRWGSQSAELNWNAQDPAKSSVTATIDVASIDTGVPALDDHLKAADFFDAEQFPNITFKSTSVNVNGPNTAELTGDLTIKDVTKPVTLGVTINKAADDGFAKAYKLGFSAKGAIKRSDFGVDLYVPMVSDDVAFTIEAEFVQPKPQE